ncbi:hypothetical protein [Piscibacillus halophilus]|uniref:PilX N-terminal n=1 Tax=Piscibacillus halophilus TaxID=571933 RepID=A0A1H9GHG7_9BACI|nr:hypothetical protein [Piscibacillus halophilus]SEQ49506.1 hypothetical protein SAMN05216362_11543 [Piscibacillus halophilus]
MEQWKREEKGAALIIVLMTIVLIMLFSIAMMSSILSNAKQNHVMKQSNRSTHIAEMGATYIQHQFVRYLEENDVELNEDTIQHMISETILHVDSVVVDEEHPERFFELSPNAEVTPTPEGSKISVNVIGYDSEFQEELSLVFNIKNREIPIDEWIDESETPPPPPEDPDYHYENSVKWKKNRTECPQEPDSSYYLSDSLAVNCDAIVGNLYTEGLVNVKSSSLTVNGRAVLNGLDISTLSKVLIKGNAYINSELTSTNNPNSELLVCGHTRFKEKIDYRGHFAVRGYVVADNQITFSHNPAQFGHDAILYNGLNLKGTNLTVDGDLTIFTDLDVQSFHNQLGGDLYVAGDLIIYSSDDSEPIINPEGEAFHTGVNVDVTFPECDDAPPLESSSEFVVDLEDGNY